MLDGSSFCVGPGKVVDPDVLNLKEGEGSVANEVEMGGNLGGVEAEW